MAGVGHTSRARGAPGPAPPPFWAGCHARPAGGVIQGGRGATPQEETGRPCQCTGGRCGRGGPQRPCRGGAPGMAPALWGACHARPAGGFIQAGGAERRRGRRRGAPAGVQGPIKTGQAGPTGVGRRGRRLPAVTVPPPPPKSRVSPLPALYPPSPQSALRSYSDAVAMTSSRSTGVAPTEEMTTPSAERVGRPEEMAALSAGRAAPASGGTPARSDRRPAAAGVRAGEAPTTGAAKSVGHAAATVRTSGAPASTGASKAKGSTAATPRARGAAASAPVTPTGAIKSSGVASATASGRAVRLSRPASGATPSRESSAAGSQATPPPLAPRRSKSTAGSATASRASRAAGRSSDENAAAPSPAAARVLLPPSRPGTPLAAAAAAAAAPAVGGEDPMEQDSPPPVPRRVRPPAVEEAGPAGAELGALVQWTPPHAPSQSGECRQRALYEAIPVSKQGPDWKRWLTRHPVQYELPAGVTADLPALLEAEDAPWVERVAARPSNVMDGATEDDVPPVVALEWACCFLPYSGESDPHFHHQDARTERRVRETSGILVSASQVESTQIHVSARRDYYVPTPTWWSAMEVPYGFPARMPRVVAYFGTTLRRGESTPAAAILETQWVLEVAGM